MTDTAATILRRARELISRPECWIQGSMARDADEHEADEWGSSATCWCIMGAFSRVASRMAPDDAQPDYDDALRYMLDATGSEGTFAGDALADWNDTHGRTHADVLAAFDRAIAAAEQRREEG